MKLDPALVPLIAAALTATVASLAIMATLVGYRHQRRLAQDQRLWLKRAEAYEAVQVWVWQLDYPGESPAPFDLGSAEFRALSAQLELYASREVLDLWLALRRSNADDKQRGLLGMKSLLRTTDLQKRLRQEIQHFRKLI
ncbi:hypothetical protein [Nonomuraea candida]|uniref:hypothetical protein n=1 Tax=Nonomuraea candida TaxID=359159 RepID=UPI0012F77DA4|nr:hypothetical protein [Nonomuraea candida]